jgi:hypothetical protein
VDKTPEKETKKEMLQNILENKKKETTFQLFFLEDNPNQSVKVEEMNEIDFEQVRMHLENGESVFIAPKRERKSDENFIAYQSVKEPWYFLRS